MRVLVLGAGPIEIGQAAEFDYAGTQACTALREEGVEVILVNSNPATIMTDPHMADRVYVEPLNCRVVEEIIKKERPGFILATMGGQTALNLALDLEAQGVLSRWDVSLLGTSIESIKLAEDRRAFRSLLAELTEPFPVSAIVTDASEALHFANQMGLPIVVRPAYTLGGSGGGFASSAGELKRYVASGLRESPIQQVLVEQSIAGLVEVEFEVLRDSFGYAVIVCELENVDPVGIHTGDSLVVAPALTITKAQRTMLRKAALRVVDKMGILGSCNVQFALNSETNEYYFIEVNPRVSRSSALASKATGFPIAQVAAKLALGHSLNDFEVPELNHVAVKIPRWPFDKFVTAHRRLGTQMKSTGEIMALGGSFTEALQKGIRSLELKWPSLFVYPFAKLANEQLVERLQNPDDERVFLLAEYLRRGHGVGSLATLTNIKEFYLTQIQKLVDFHRGLENTELSPQLLQKAKEKGFSDVDLAQVWGLSQQELREKRLAANVKPFFHRMPTQSGQFFYSSYLPCKIAPVSDCSHKQGIVVLGSGPIRIGQGIEFDYSTVHAAGALGEQGYESVIINNNPETVSTDASVAHRLYFEPLTEEDVLDVLEHEQALGVMVQFGGQTAINLVNSLAAGGIKVYGTQPSWIAKMEDRRQFDVALEELGLPRPRGLTANTKAEAERLITQLVYPIMVRPSYVLGGRGMEVIGSAQELKEYLSRYSAHSYPLLFDEYLPGIELEVDAIASGGRVFVPGIMEHLERAGVHSGDSIAVYPAQSLTPEMIDRVFSYTEILAKGFNIQGLINIQYVLSHGGLYVLEVNPRSSRTVPFLSKVVGIPLARLAAQVCLGKDLEELGYVGLAHPQGKTVAVKMPVFSFAKLEGMDVTLGPEMKSTGEVMGRDLTLSKALSKAFQASNVALPVQGKVLLTVADKDKNELLPLARRLQRLNLKLYATLGTASYLKERGVLCEKVSKLDQSAEILELIRERGVDLVVNTFTKGGQPHRDGFRIRSQASLQDVLCFTSLDTLGSYLQVVEDQMLWVQPLEKEGYRWR